jgi:hypothetical protein
MSEKRLNPEEVLGYMKDVTCAELTGSPPVEPGVVDAGIVNPTSQELNRLPPLKRVELSDSLSSLSNDFVFFNHTMLFSKGGLDFDPIKEYQVFANKPELVNYVVFNRPIFSGLDFPDNTGGHDFILSFVPIEHWDTIYRAIGNITILNRANGYMFLCEAVKVKIPDPKQPSLTIEPYLWKMKGSQQSWVYQGYPVPKAVKRSADYEAMNLMKAINNEPR